MLSRKVLSLCRVRAALLCRETRLCKCGKNQHKMCSYRLGCLLIMMSKFTHASGAVSLAGFAPLCDGVFYVKRIGLLAN